MAAGGILKSDSFERIDDVKARGFLVNVKHDHGRVGCHSAIACKELVRAIKVIHLGVLKFDRMGHIFNVSKIGSPNNLG